MTAQNDDGLNLGYPSGPATTPVPATPTTATLSPNPAPTMLQSDSTPSVDDLDPNRGQQISGPSFDAPGAAVAPVTIPVAPAPVQSTPAIMPDPVPATTAPVEETKEVFTGLKPEEKSEEKKDNPLQALAKKLAALKSELIEESPGESSDVKGEVNESDSAEVSPEPTMVEPVTDPSTSLPTEPAVPTPLPGNDLLSQNLSTPLPETIADSNQSYESTNTEIPAVPDPATLTPALDLPALDTGSVQSDISMPVPDTNTIPDPALDVPLSTTDALPQTESQVDEIPVTDTPAETLQPQTVDMVVGGSDVPVQEVIDESSTDSISTEEVAQNTTANAKYPMNINKILDVAIERNASDVHISVGYPVMLRIDGTLIELHNQIVSTQNAEELIFPILSDQKKELLEVNREVDLAHTHRHGGEARFRINAFYTRENLAAAFRLIPTRIRTVEELQLPALYNQFASLKQGLVLVTGPTGHGKSTTLAAILQKVNSSRAAHILTIEDPIEYIFPKSKAIVDQREMHDDTHSWAVALKSALRQDPDVILVGEMRDYETIAATITLAETGHLVFATLHTNSASQTIDRIIDVFPENQQAQVRAQLSNILEAVVAQRLIPIDGGGRRAVSEIMIANPAIKNLIREGKTHQIDNVIRTSADIGMVSLEHSLVRLVREGLITMDKAQEYAVHPEEVVRLLKS
ncbi:MAG: twitching motility protein [candidate division WS6 bacterium GW2011_GWF2_39_15]|uniref:Twitching motility protein n=1 Tax=candidate division WS6 bacterium GW2011_GWF2_39_15 TaxID=1619100 RepID=A0A0G0Q728_9BACT|nr:MAG: twitching motility protein [candidate division WS6 bacterium GW2011_GWF2_39_15]